MDLFRSLSLAELEAGIRNLSFQIMSGATNISSPDAGSAGYISRGEAMKLLRLLERSRSRRLGLPADPSDRVRQIQVLPAHEFTEY